MKFFKAELAAEADVIDPDEFLDVVDDIPDVEGLRPSIFPSLTIASPRGMVFF
jgi:hypothetical protein